MQFSRQAINEAFLGWLAQQRPNLILWIPVCLGLGACLYFSQATEPPEALVALAFIAASLMMAVIGWIALRSDDPNRHYLWLIGISAIFWIVSGWAVAQMQARMVATPMVAAEDKIGMVEGRIYSLDLQEGGRGWIMVLDQLQIERWRPDEIPRKIRLSVRKSAQGFSLGDRVRVLTKLRSAAPPAMPGAFDFQRFYYFQGIGALGFSLKPPEIVSKSAPDDVSFILQRLRKQIDLVVKKSLPEREAGIATALMTGERASISSDDWTALRNSGLAHIISISGLHVALMAAPVFFIVRLLLAAIPFVALRWPIKKIAAAAALIACCAYVALVVPSVPTYRALMMTGIGLIAIMLDRSPFSLRLVALAAAVVLLFSPDSVWSASFQMSFAAVAALVAVADVMRPYWSEYLRNGGWGRKIVIYMAGAVLTTCVASVATSPFSSFHFQQIASYSIIANTLAIPLAGLVIMPMIVVSFLLLPFGAADLSLQAMGVGIEWMLEVAVWVAELPGAVIHTPAWPQAALILFVCAGLCLILLNGRTRWVSLPVTLAGVIVILCAPEAAVLISQGGKLIMVNAEDQAFVSSRRKDKFTLETWQKRIDVEKNQVVAWPKEGRARAGAVGVHCDTEICRITLPGLKVSTGQSLYAMREECSWADLIVVPEKKMKPCGKARVMDVWALRSSGAIAIMEDGKIRTVREDQGLRPWSTWPEKRHRPK